MSKLTHNQTLLSSTGARSGDRREADYCTTDWLRPTHEAHTAHTHTHRTEFSSLKKWAGMLSVQDAERDWELRHTLGRRCRIPRDQPGAKKRSKARCGAGRFDGGPVMRHVQNDGCLISRHRHRNLDYARSLTPIHTNAELCRHWQERRKGGEAAFSPRESEGKFGVDAPVNG